MTAVHLYERQAVQTGDQMLPAECVQEDEIAGILEAASNILGGKLEYQKSLKWK